MFIGYNMTNRNYELLDWEKKLIIVTPHGKFNKRYSGIPSSISDESTRKGNADVIDLRRETEAERKDNEQTNQVRQKITMMTNDKMPQSIKLLPKTPR